MLALAMLLANAGNYILNLFLGRVLTPAEFSDANLMVTFLFSLTSIALCLQLVAARFIARADERGMTGDSDRLAQRLRRIAVGSGIAAGAVLAGASPFWQGVFHTASPAPFVILGIGIPFWLVQAVGRGVMQARLKFAPLAVSYVAEMVVRVGLGIGLVSAGLGVNGATVALTTSFVVTCAIVTITSRSNSTEYGAGIDSRDVRAYAALVSILLIGQIIANNSDIFIAKANFTPTDAGIYAAVALVGRAVFFLAWSVATVIFPVVARRHATGSASSGLLRGGILAVVGIGVACSLGALWLGGPVLGIVLGSAYADLSVPLAAYAAMTTLFAIGNLVASYRLSQSKVTESWMLLAASVVQLVLLLVWHDTMTTLIAMQSVAMGLLVVALAARAIVARTRAGRTGTAVPFPLSIPEPQEVLL
jgi:O-antigen/teichoic acid export membrane protein